MISIIVLMAGPDRIHAERDGEFPAALTEFQGQPIIERLVASCSGIPDARMVFVARQADIKKFRLDNVIGLLSPGARIVPIDRPSKGAACSALLASAFVDGEQPLLILSIDDVLDIHFGEVIAHFQQQRWDGGVVTFPSVHPRYSFVRLDAGGTVVEAAEKNPISRHATAGFYYYARAKDFVEAAQAMIRKDAHVNDIFYVCPTYNEMVLRQARIGVWPIAKEQYHPLKSERQLMQYEHLMEGVRS